MYCRFRFNTTPARLFTLDRKIEKHYPNNGIMVISTGGGHILGGVAAKGAFDRDGHVAVTINQDGFFWLKNHETLKPVFADRVENHLA